MKQATRMTAIAALIILLAAGRSWAGDVRVEAVHLCCGSCQETVGEALGDVKGVSKVTADLNNKVVSFTAQDLKSAEAGIRALAQAGFFGKATHADEKIAFPPSGAKQGRKADTVLIAGVHLCCLSCVEASQKALKNVEGLTTIDIDRKERTIKLRGEKIDVAGAVTALNRGGFFGRVQQPEK